MSKRHPLAEEIKRFIDAPDAWQWQSQLPSAPANPCGEWKNVTFEGAMARHATKRYAVRLIPKPSMIPSHLLPEGWEVERLRCGRYKVQFPTKEMGSGTYGPSSPMYHLLRHIDPEAT